MVAGILKQYSFPANCNYQETSPPISAIALVIVVIVVVVAYFAVFPSNQLAVHVRDRLKGDRHVIVATSAKGTIRLVDREATILAHVLLLEANNMAPHAYLEVTL